MESMNRGPLRLARSSEDSPLRGLLGLKCSLEVLSFGKGSLVDPPGIPLKCSSEGSSEGLGFRVYGLGVGFRV